MDARKRSYRPWKSCPDGSDTGRIRRKELAGRHKSRRRGTAGLDDFTGRIFGILNREDAGATGDNIMRVLVRIAVIVAILLALLYLGLWYSTGEQGFLLIPGGAPAQ
ncbi:MAG: hypothetical protein EOR60_13230 [Mesorhizobium sp.]|nr:MAG: hypothetical protein EOR60_13230 [Mesorhizobium sp.]